MMRKYSWTTVGLMEFSLTQLFFEWKLRFTLDHLLQLDQSQALSLGHGLAIAMNWWVAPSGLSGWTEKGGICLITIILEVLCHLFWKWIDSGRGWVVGGNVQGSFRARNSGLREQPCPQVVYLMGMGVQTKAEVTSLSARPSEVLCTFS